MGNIGLLNRTETVLLIIDLQARLMPVIADAAQVFSQVNRLIAGAEILQVPTIITEQYPQGLGHTATEVLLPSQPLIIEKISFSCLLSDTIHDKLRTYQAKSLVLAGVEAHICVLKTALDALDNGYEVHIVADAVSSRRLFDKEIALARLRQAGAYIATTEMILFQLMNEAGTAEFKQISKLIK